MCLNITMTNHFTETLINVSFSAKLKKRNSKRNSRLDFYDEFIYYQMKILLLSIQFTFFFMLVGNTYIEYQTTKYSYFKQTLMGTKFFENTVWKLLVHYVISSNRQKEMISIYFKRMHLALFYWYVNAF